MMLQDKDFRVRLFMARRIGVLFQTWDGHEELFQDIWFVTCKILYIRYSLRQFLIKRFLVELVYVICLAAWYVFFVIFLKVFGVFVSFFWLYPW